jgi:outer membrane protein
LPERAPSSRDRLNLTLRLSGGAAATALMALIPAVGSAESLYDAITMAYETNPALHAQQAQLRSTDEGLVQAKAGYGPQASVSGQAGYNAYQVHQPAGPFSPATVGRYSASTATGTVTLAQPLFTSGAVRAQVDAASANVGAGRQTLRQAEAQLIVNVITAYEDVRRDRETIKVLNTEIDALTDEYKETKARSELGDLTKTDVSQSAARVAAARAQLIVAKGQLNASNAEYVAVVGQSPGELEPEPDLPGVPTTADDAFAAADQANPEVLAAIEAERAADARVRQAKSAFGPTVSLQVTAGATPYEPYIGGQYNEDLTIGLVFTQPLFTSGINSSKVREALDDDNKAQFDVDDARRGVVEQIAKSWDQFVSLRNAGDEQTRQLTLETTAVEGDRVEERAGLRSNIDLLNAELELANTQIGLIQNRHDAYVASANLLASMGRLELRRLRSAAKTYDPEAVAKRIGDPYAPPWTGVVAAIDSIGVPSGVRPVSFDTGAPQPVHPSVSGAEPVGVDP